MESTCDPEQMFYILCFIYYSLTQCYFRSVEYYVCALYNKAGTFLWYVCTCVCVVVCVCLYLFGKVNLRQFIHYCVFVAAQVKKSRMWTSAQLDSHQRGAVLTIAVSSSDSLTPKTHS